MTITAIVGGGGGGPFSTVAAWAAYMAGRSLTGPETWAASGTTTDTTSVAVNSANWTPNGHLVTLTAAAGEGVSAGGRAAWLTTGRAILTTNISSADGYTFGGALLLVSDLQIESSSSSGNTAVRAINGATVERCVIRNASTFAVIGDGSGAGVVFKSCLLISTPTNGGGSLSNGGGLDLIRCTFIGNGGTGRGIDSGNYTLTKARGCLVYGFGTDFFNTSLAGSLNNATDKGTFGGTGFGTSGQVSVTSADFVNTGSGTEDYAPASGSTKLLGTGAVISGASIDLFGTSLPQGAVNDIGAVERPVTGPTIGTQPTNQTANEGATSTYTVSATGTGALHYQWKRAAPGSGTFSNVGTDSSSYTTATLAPATDHGATFKVDVTDDNGTTTSSTVTQTVRAVSTTTRPSADLTVTGWTASGGGSLFDMVDEVSASDADYITSPALSPSTAPVTFGLQYPLATGTWTLGVRARTTAGAGTLLLELLDSAGTVVGTSATQALTTAFATYSLSITTTGVAERARITITNP